MTEQCARPRAVLRTYPNWFYLPAALVFGVFFLVPTALAFYFSLTRWTLFDATFIGLDNYVAFLGDPQLMSGLRNTIIYAVLTSGLKVIISLPLAMLLTSSIRLKGLFRGIIFFPVLVSTVAVGITFATLMQPSIGLINTALGFLGLPQPDWLGNPDLALYSVALVDVWKGIGIAMVIFIAGIIVDPAGLLRSSTARGRNMGEVPSRHPSTGPQRDVHGHPAVVYRRAADIRPDLDHDTRRSRLRIGRAHIGDLQGVSGGVLWLVDRRQCRALHSRHDHRVSADAVLQSSWSLSYEESGSSLRSVWVDAAALIVIGIVFVVPFVFILLTAAKTRPEAALFQFSWPSKFQLIENIRDVMAFGDNRMFLALWNSTLLTVGSVTLIVLFSALVAFVMQRRGDRVASVVSSIMLAGLDHPSGRRANDLPSAVAWSLQDTLRPDHGRSRIHPALRDPDLPCVHGIHPARDR